MMQLRAKNNWFTKSMHTPPIKIKFLLFSLAILAGLFGLAACRPSDPPLMKALDTSDFESVHSVAAGKTNKYLIMGGLPVEQPSVKITPELSFFLGRWEGYSYNPPLKKDRKFVLVIQSISATGGTAAYWVAENLQYPDVVGQVRFRVVSSGPTPAIEWQVAWPDGTKTDESYRYVSKKDQLEGWSRDANGNHPVGPYVLTHDQTFFIYKDYPQYLSGKGIYADTYQNSQLNQYGPGYLYYLPDGYQENKLKAWPLLIFLHDGGDTGGNIYSLARSSPFLYLRDVGSLPMIVAAPQLSGKPGQASFSLEYLDGFLAEVRAKYRVNTARIYITGLGMGGEAVWRFALHQPDTFAAVAPFAAFLEPIDQAALKTLANVPVWAIHGQNDSVVAAERGQAPVDALNVAGGQARFTALLGHDHDITDMYAEVDFYDWLMRNYKH